MYLSLRENSLGRLDSRTDILIFEVCRYVLFDFCIKSKMIISLFCCVKFSICFISKFDMSTLLVFALHSLYIHTYINTGVGIINNIVY